MPLHDHFRPPLAPVMKWESFHAQWAVAMAKDLNSRLPPRFLCQTQIHLGARAESDVIEYDLDPAAPPADWSPEDEPGGVAVMAPPDRVVTADIARVGRFAVEVVDTEMGYRVAAVIELVSPGNKDRAEKRAAFAGKAAGYLMSSLGLIVVDTVTVRRANLHDELLGLFGAGDPPLGGHLYATAYAPVPAGEKLRLDIWAKPLAVGQPLPTLPLQVLALGRVQVDLDATYREACEWSRIPD